MTFPANWPSDCPPRDAVDAAGLVFRTHTTWWAFEGVNRTELFAVVREEQ